MVRYLVDTNSFRVLGNYYPETFPSFWEQMEELVTAGRLLSVREVQKELQVQNTSEHLATWVEAHDHLFLPPVQAEMNYVAEIFKIHHFRQLIGEKQRLRGLPVADPWLVARAGVNDCTVVTKEAPKPHAAKIPNVCEHFKAPHCTVQGLLRGEGWKY
jgi:hypothetical protein